MMRATLFALALAAATSAQAAGPGPREAPWGPGPREAPWGPGPREAPWGPEEAAFLAENDAAMTRMMRAMEVKPSGDVDRDFVAMMVPHHQGAVDMARALLRYGRNEQLRRLAQEIIATQQQEITVMRQAVGQPPLPTATR